MALTSRQQAAFKRFEAEGWSRRAESYDQVTGRLTSAAAGAVLDAAAVKAGGRVLDVATGPGHLAAAAAERGAAAVGIDISDGMLALASRRHPGIRFELGDAEDLGYGDASFEAVVGGFVLNHLPQPERAAAEAARVLAPGGHVAYAVWDRPERMRPIGVMMDAIERAGAERPDDLPPGPDGFRFADDRAFVELLRDARLEDVSVRELELKLRVRGADELWDGVLASTVRSATVVERQDADVRARIRAHFDELVLDYTVDGGLVLPAVAKIGSGRRP